MPQSHTDINHLSFDHCALMLQVKTDVLFVALCCSVHLEPAGGATGIRGPARACSAGSPVYRHSEAHYVLIGAKALLLLPVNYDLNC